MWLEGVLLITTAAVGEDAWHMVSLKDLKERFACVARKASCNTIGGHYVDPDELVSNFDSAILCWRSQSGWTEGRKV